MKGTDIIIAGIAGTTAFTLFSYLASKTFDSNYEEPELLGEMVEEIPGMKEKESQFTGWLSHYLVGIAFAEGYKQLIKTTGIKPSIGNGVIAGLLSGVPAALSWDTALKLHPSAPRERTIDFYFQLVTGHAIFGAVVFGILSMFNKKDTQNALESIEADSLYAK